MVPEQTSAEVLNGRIFRASLEFADLLAVYLGDRLGYYAALASEPSLTAGELAVATATHPRYAREWLEQQAMSGFLTTEDHNLGPEERRYALPDGHAEVLVDGNSLNYLAPLARMYGAAAVQLPALLEAYRSGGGVAWSQFGTDMRESQADVNRPWFLHTLGSEWIPAVAELELRLSGGGKVADVGCGFGWSSIGIAKAYPNVTVDGIDADQPSIVAANRHAAEEGVADRVRFLHADAATAAGEGSYDVVTAFECLHDMSQPVAVLASMRRLAREDGFVLVVDERAAERFVPNGDDLERFLYGFSLFICLPDGMSQQPSAGTGTLMRPATLDRYAVEAGYSSVEILPIDHFQFRFYRLVK